MPGVLEPAPWLRPATRLSLRRVIPRLGAWTLQACRCPVEANERFPGRRQFAPRFELAGLRQLRGDNLGFGIACIHSGARS